MPRLTIIAHVTAKPDKIAFVKAQLLRLVEITRSEVGCVQYDLHQDNENPAHFMFFELWDSRELWQQHMNAPHLKDYLAATDGAIANFALHEMTQVA